MSKYVEDEPCDSCGYIGLEFVEHEPNTAEHFICPICKDVYAVEYTIECELEE